MSTKKPVWLEKKLIDPKDLERVCGELREQGLTIATLNGSFDLLHAGHLFIIHQASLQADRLIVALNSDESIRRYKSPKRPIVTLDYRMEMMAALEFVSHITWFEETDPCALLRRIRPHVHANGVEYGAKCIEADTVEEIGARLHLIERIPTLSTSELIEKIRCVV